LAYLVADAVLNELAGYGTEYVFGYPGGTNLALFDVFSRNQSMKLVLARHEQGAVHMADGYSRATGKPGICLVSRGVGAANTILGLHNAYQESVPIITIVGQVDSDILYKDAFEEIDLETLFKPVTKYQIEVFQPERAAELTGRAIHFAMSGRKRPVLISIPGDIARVEVSPKNRGEQLPAEGTLSLNKKFNSEVYEALESAQRPLIIAGGGAKDYAGENLLAKFAQITGSAVTSAWMRNDIFPYKDPHYLGMLGTGFRSMPATKKALAEADLIIAVGCRFSENTTSRYQLGLAGKTLIHIDKDQEEIGKIYPPQFGICGNYKAVLADMCEQVSVSQDRHKSRETWISRLRGEYLEQTALPEINGDSITPYDIIRSMNNHLEPDTTIVTDSGAFVYFITKFYRFNLPNTFFAPAGGSMGFGLPAAIGVKFSKPDKTVVAVMGDGGAAMTIQELDTAVRCGKKVIAVVFNNSVLGNITTKQIKQHGGRLMGSTFNDVDFAIIARGFGAEGITVRTGEEMDKAMKLALETDNTVLIDVKLDDRHILP